MPRNVAPDQQIQLRRRQEEQLAAAEAATVNDRVLKQYADWENRTDQKIEREVLVRAIDRVQARSDESLEKRRARLAELLSKEQLQYEQELEGLTETQEERRDRIAKKALELRAEREKLRKDFASSQKARLFKANCPQVIDASSKATALQVAADREEQLLWNRQQQDQAKRETQYYDSLWAEEHKKKEQRHQEDQQRQKDIQKQLQHNLSIQTAAVRKNKAEEAEAERLEGERFREELRQGAEEDAAKERQRREQQHALGRQNKKYNVELEELKAADRKKELEADKKFLKDLLTRVREDEEQERLAKKASRDAAVEHMKAVEKQMMTAAGAETELDRLWQIESNKEWDKKEARWRAEQVRRDKLLQETFEERGKQVQANRARKLDKKLHNEQEREMMINQIEQVQAKEREQAAKRLAVARDYQKCILDQARFKKEADDAERKGRDLQRVACEIAEREYQERVAKEITEIESRKPEKYSHIRLTTRRNF